MHQERAGVDVVMSWGTVDAEPNRNGHGASPEWGAHAIALWPFA
jgi:hypothetical protein